MVQENDPFIDWKAFMFTLTKNLNKCLFFYPNVIGITDLNSIYVLSEFEKRKLSLFIQFCEKKGLHLKYLLQKC